MDDFLVQAAARTTATLLDPRAANQLKKQQTTTGLGTFPGAKELSRFHSHSLRIIKKSLQIHL